MDIKFYCPSDEIIPTRLRLEVDDNGNKGKQILYKKVEGEFAYDFTFFNFMQDEAYETAKEIGSLMERQSEDFGGRWQVANIGYIGISTIRISFRWKDSY